MTIQSFKGVSSIAALGILAACGGNTTSGGVALSSGEAARQVLSSNFADVGAALDAGETLSARAIATSTVVRNYDDQTTAVVDGTLVQISQNAAGELTMVIDGNEVAFATSDRRVESNGEVFGYEQDGSNFYYNLFSWNGELDELINSETSANPVGFYYEEPDSPSGLTGFVIVGAETSELPATGSSEYNGYARITIFPAENMTSFGDTRERLRSDEVTINVDFGAATISGSMGDLEYQEPPNDGDERFAVAGSIIMEETSINANGYSGNLTLDAAALEDSDLASADFGTYSGTFFGEGAAETGGTISVTADDADGVTSNGFGFFVAD